MVRASVLSSFGRLDTYAGSIAKASQHSHLVLPREAKGRHIGQAKPSDHVANDLEVRLVEVAFVEGIMGPGEGGRLGTRQGYASLLTRGFIRPRAYI